MCVCVCVCFVVSGWRVGMGKISRAKDGSNEASATLGTLVFCGSFLAIFWIFFGSFWNLGKAFGCLLVGGQRQSARPGPPGAVCFGVVGSGDSACSLRVLRFLKRRGTVIGIKYVKENDLGLLATVELWQKDLHRTWSSFILFILPSQTIKVYDLCPMTSI